MIGCVAILVLCISSFALVDSQSQHDHKVDVAVYYESLCTDSIKFVTKQLHPALQNGELNKHINLTLIPFGKSSMQKETVGIKFSCHHGQRECDGNKIHACALQEIKAGANQNQKDIAVNFVICLLDTVDTKDPNAGFPVKTCAESQHVQDMNDITSCASAINGTTYLEMYGNVTNAVQNPLKSVPTIVFNNKYSESESSKAEKNFVAALCDYISHDKPAVCKNGSSKGAYLQITTIACSLLMLLVTFTVF